MLINNNHLYKIDGFEEKNDFFTHYFTTRNGGVSESHLSSMNLSFTRGDTIGNLDINYKNLAKYTNKKPVDFYFSHQVHSDKIKYVTNPRDIWKPEFCCEGYDALITNKSDICLLTYHADCVPIYIVNKETSSIALVHAGWRSTAKKIQLKTIRKMQTLFGVKKEAIKIAIGPHIKKCCFEVEEDVVNIFKGSYLNHSSYFTKKNATKFMFDITGLIHNSFVEFGISENNIFISSHCTSCNNNLFFSHRASNGNCGTCGALLMINSK